jgi:DNA-binding FadR family transcriptional regulator
LTAALPAPILEAWLLVLDSGRLGESVIMPGGKRLFDRVQEASRSAHGLVTRSLGIDIITGRFAPGSPLPAEDDLLRRFGISRTALRESLKTLAAKGMIQSKTRVGTRVLPASYWNMFDPDVMSWRLEAGVDASFLLSLYEIRSALEPAAAALAADRRGDSDLARLGALADEMAAAADRESFVVTDLAFHKAILTASGNPLMQSIGSVIEAALMAAFRRSAPYDDQERLARSVAEHRAIYEAIAAADSALAAEAMRRVVRQGAINGGVITA